MWDNYRVYPHVPVFRARQSAARLKSRPTPTRRPEIGDTTPPRQRGRAPHPLHTVLSRALPSLVTRRSYRQCTRSQLCVCPWECGRAGCHSNPGGCVALPPLHLSSVASPSAQQPLSADGRQHSPPPLVSDVPIGPLQATRPKSPHTTGARWDHGPPSVQQGVLGLDVPPPTLQATSRRGAAGRAPDVREAIRGNQGAPWRAPSPLMREAIREAIPPWRAPSPSQT